MNAVGCSFGDDALQLPDLRFVCRHNQFAAAAVAYAALNAVVVQHLFALHTKPGLERAFWVVNASVYDLTVARAGACSDGVGGFKNHHLAALQSQRACDRQTHHTRTYDDAIDFIQLGSSL